jgi:DNA-binding MarR family transcriptional regulator
MTQKATYTEKQGQYLAFIYYYTKVNGQAPAEADIQRYFRTTPPSVHQMILKLEELGFISRTPGQGRSIRVLLLPEQLPFLK